MRHRMGIAGMTGLGNPTPAMLNNEGKPDKKMLKEAVGLFFSKWGYCDYFVHLNGTLIGIEPAYQYEHLKVIFIAEDKENCYIENGKAWGGYGSQIVRTRKYYRDYKYRSKFTKFIDKWHPEVRRRIE